MFFKADPLNFMWLLLCCLAAWRITLAICYENGPFGVMMLLRKSAYKLKLNSLIECPHCMGLWVSVCIVLLVYRIGLPSIVLCFAISGAISITIKLTGTDNEDEIEEVE